MNESFRDRKNAFSYTIEIRQLFLDTDSRNPFCLLTLTGQERPATYGAEFVFFAHSVADLYDEQRRFTLTAEDLALLNPNTRTCPVFRSKRDANLAKAIYARVPVLINESKSNGNLWQAYYLRLIHYSDHASMLYSAEQCLNDGYSLSGNIWQKYEEQRLPVYESKLVNAYDHRYATYEVDVRDATDTEKNDPGFFIKPRYWVDESFFNGLMEKYKYRPSWFITYRDVVRSTDMRTLLSTILPRIPASLKLPVLGFQSDNLGWSLVANFNSFPLDYVARQNVGGVSMSFYILKQLPILPPFVYAQSCKWSLSQSLHKWLLPRVLELTYTAYDMKGFAEDCGYDGEPFCWDEERRFILRSELDAAYFHLYGIAHDEVDYIMETFPIVKRKDEAQFGEYRTNSCGG
jgi:hypothetical protein